MAVKKEKRAFSARPVKLRRFLKKGLRHRKSPGPKRKKV